LAVFTPPEILHGNLRRFLRTQKSRMEIHGGSYAAKNPAWKPTAVFAPPEIPHGNPRRFLRRQKSRMETRDGFYAAKNPARKPTAAPVRSLDRRMASRWLKPQGPAEELSIARRKIRRRKIVTNCLSYP